MQKSIKVLDAGLLFLLYRTLSLFIFLFLIINQSPLRVRRRSRKAVF